jgi:predicted glycosyltransferase
MQATEQSVIEAPSLVESIKGEKELVDSRPERFHQPDLSGKSIWIDLDNSPHVPFFLPIMEELKQRGAHILLTGRNTYQVCDLLDYFGVRCKVVGRHYGKNKVMKVLGTLIRACQLIPIAVRDKLDLALSHGSRAQVLVGKALHIPTVMVQDYEYATGTGFVEADWIFTPQIVPNTAMSKRPERVLKYPGLKEDVYVPNFHPNSSILEQLGIGPEDLVVTLRPPATEAHYHNPESDILFSETLKFLDRPHVKMITLPRSVNQHHALLKQWSSLIAAGRMVIPDSAVNGLNLIWFSDLVISGGGTMNREAAALGVPVYSIFRGTIGAVDHYLSQQGRLILIETPSDIGSKVILKRWNRPSRPSARNRPALETIVGNIAAILTSRPERRQ